MQFPYCTHRTVFHNDQLLLWSFSGLLISEQLIIHGGPYFAGHLTQLEQDRAVQMRSGCWLKSR